MQQAMPAGLLSFKRLVETVGSFITGFRKIAPALLMVALFFACSRVIHGNEYFVGLRGDDGADGVSESKPFRSVNKGISLLKPGDTLTILPGDYSEDVRTRLSGKPDAPVTIRAKRPGTVLLRGDVDAPDFTPAPGLRYTWSAPFERTVEGVGERDTFKTYAFVPSPEEVQDVRGSCFYDVPSKKLYVHTSDSGAPESHVLIVSVTNSFGLLIEPPKGEKTVHDVIVDGLAFTGYMNREQTYQTGQKTRWGLYILEAERCIVRRCTAFLNGGGIGLVRLKDCIVEDCAAFGNYSTYNSSGGNIICWTPATNSIIRRCVAHTTKSNGIRFYGGGAYNCTIEDNLAYDCAYGEIWIKGGITETSRMLRNVSLGALHFTSGVAENIRSNLCNYGSNPCTNLDDNIQLSKQRRLEPDDSFADPAHHDYRLQSDSPLRGKGVNGTDPGPFPYRDEVLFVSLKGNDTNSGTSAKQAWRTLDHAAKTARPGQTVYVLAGAYNEPLAPVQSGAEGKPIIFRNRGYEQVTLAGNSGDKIDSMMRLKGVAYVEVDGFRTEQSADADKSTNCLLRNCSFGQGVSATDASGLVVEHCSLAQINLSNCRDVTFTGNVFRKRAKRPESGAAFVMDKTTVQTLFSDWNAIVKGAPVAAVDDNVYPDMGSWQQAFHLDARSRIAPEDGHEYVPGRGPLASMLGVVNRRKVQVPLRIEDVKVHSFSATTANIEWWTPTVEATTLLEWGDTQECTNRVESIFDGEIFHTVGLRGLKPDTTYYFRVKTKAPVWEFHTNEELAAAEREKERETASADGGSFRTLVADAPPKTYQVSPDGDDRRDGLSPATAWRTLRHAAECVIAGDTVLVHEGTYEEYVLVRATGEKERPITFRAAPGAKVWMDGSGMKRPTAFRLAFKHNIILDGFYLHNFRASEYQSSAEGGAIHVIGGGNHIFRRCFYDGRSINYMPYFVLAADTRDFTVENCVIINGWANASFWRCPDLNIRHCVFYNGLIRALVLFNAADQNVNFSRNIICDNIPSKIGNSLLELWHIEAYRGDYNCYFSRVTATERVAAGYSRIKGELKPAKLLLAALQSLTGQDKHSIFANPGMKVVKEMRLKYDKDQDYDLVEMHRKGADIQPLDFRDFFADPAGPCGKATDGKPIGLDPAAFEDKK